MQLDDRHNRPCPICQLVPAGVEMFLEERIDQSKLNDFSFSSRKEPEHLCYQMIRCPSCDLVYVDRPPSQDALADAYHAADYDSHEEADDAAASYMRAFAPALSRIHKGAALEIGTGTGSFLEELSRFGFSSVMGVEPSAAAIAAAPPHRKTWIREGIFVADDFQPASFDLVCCFMTLEHVRDPLDIAQSAYRLLRPSGAFLSVTHDYRSAVNRALGRRSPIVDIEHMQLFSRRSVTALLEQAGYARIEAHPFANRYTLRYWNRLMPFPAGIKKSLQTALSAVGLDRMKLALRVGNTATAGFKPDYP